jgi:glycolate oxidase FAD binding subunit
MHSIVQQLESILGSSAVVAWDNVEPPLKTQIVQAAPHSPIECVVYPTSAPALAEVLTCAHLNGWRLLPCGRGSKLHWGGLAEDIRLVVSVAKLNRLIDHASSDLTVTAEAGVSLADLQTTLATTGQFLAIDPAYADQATLGGIVATADTGALRQRYGGIRDMLIGISFVRSDGKVTKAGGRVVKNVAGYDLMKLLTGSYGTLGILTELTFRIYPLPPAAGTVVLTGDAALLAKATATLLASALTPTAIELLTPTTCKNLALGSEMGLMVRFQSMDVSVAQQIEQVMQLGQILGLAATRIPDPEESHLWQQLREQIDVPPSSGEITCKIGVEPIKALAALSQMEPLVATGTIHASSGLGIVQAADAAIDSVLKLRQICQSHGGFLTVLAAPSSLKAQLDVWGDSGSALEIMQRLKTQFDPNTLLSPRRFVGNI